jgi:VanZ family protein
MGPLSRFAPPLAVMALIFVLSAQPNLGTDLGVLDTILRKLAHLAIFGALWLALFRATRYARPVAATALAVAYAISDEVHQSFVDGRAGLVSDVAIDTLGMGLAALAYVVYRRRRERASATAAEAEAYSQPRSVASRTA